MQWGLRCSRDSIRYEPASDIDHSSIIPWSGLSPDVISKPGQSGMPVHSLIFSIVQTPGLPGAQAIQCRVQSPVVALHIQRTNGYRGLACTKSANREPLLLHVREAAPDEEETALADRRAVAAFLFKSSEALCGVRGALRTGHSSYTDCFAPLECTSAPRCNLAHPSSRAPELSLGRELRFQSAQEG